MWSSSYIVVFFTHSLVLLLLKGVKVSHFQVKKLKSKVRQVDGKRETPQMVGRKRTSVSLRYNGLASTF